MTAARVAVLVLLGLLIASGCTVVSEPDPATRCDWMANEPPADASGLVILLDRSNSVRAARAGDQVADPRATLEEILDAAVERGDVVSIGSFDGSAASVRWTAERQVTDRGNKHPRKRAAAAATAKECLGALLAEAAATPPAQPGTDILGAVGIGRDAVVTAARDRRIVVVTDGLSTTGCADLTGFHVGERDLIARVRALCVGRGRELPDLSGVHLELIGVGHPVGTAAQPGTPHLRWLADLWLGLCDDAKASSCSVSVQPLQTQTTEDRTAVRGVPDPQVEYADVAGGVRQPPKVIQLSGEVLFERNSSVISTQGSRAIAVVAAGVRGQGQVVVNGYTQADASPAANAKLAAERAGAVAAELRGHGVADVVPVGHEGRAPQCPQGDSPAALRCTRRVDIVVGGTG